MTEDLVIVLLVLVVDIGLFYLVCYMVKLYLYIPYQVEHMITGTSEDYS